MRQIRVPLPKGAAKKACVFKEIARFERIHELFILFDKQNACYYNVINNNLHEMTFYYTARQFLRSRCRTCCTAVIEAIRQGVKALDSIVVMIVLLVVAGALTAILLGRKYGYALLPAVLALALCGCISLCVYFFADSFARSGELIGVAAGGVLLSVGVYALANALSARRTAALDAARLAGSRKPLVEFEGETSEELEDATQGEKHFEGLLTEAEEKPELPKLWEEELQTAERAAFDAALDEVLYARTEGEDAADEADAETLTIEEAFLPQPEETEEEDSELVLPLVESPRAQTVESETFLPVEPDEEEASVQTHESLFRELSAGDAMPPLDLVEEFVLSEEDAFIPPLEEEAPKEEAAEPEVEEPAFEPVEAPVLEPVAEETALEPEVEEPAFEPVEAPVLEPVAEETAVEPEAEAPVFERVEELVLEPAAEETAVEPEVEEPAFEPVEELVLEPVAEETAAEPEVEEAAFETVEAPAFEPVAEETAAEPEVEEPAFEPVEAPVLEPVAEEVAAEPVAPEQASEQADDARRKEEAMAQIKQLVAAKRYDEALHDLFALLNSGAALSEDEKRQLLIIMKLLKEKGL